MLRLESQFASELPELAVPWQAEQAPRPQLVVLNETLASELGLDVDWLHTPAGTGFLVGANLPEGAHPVAQAYAGHQFGAYAPRLGDGRALLLGELRDPHGRLWDVHLKGSGPTPFARGGDGRAVLGPMLRELIVSEGMHALGTPTTRALAVVRTGRTVLREFPEDGAVLVRVAASHLRVGTFQYASAFGDAELLGRVAEHALRRHLPDGARDEHPALALYREVVARQARLVAQWLLVGFVHGVMNTDNTTISGETIDYGPCAFLDAYDPAACFSSIDHAGRYRFGNQPAVAEWNLARLAESMLPLFAPRQADAVALAQQALAEFLPQYRAAFLGGMRRKLGLAAEVSDARVQALAEGFLTLLAEHRVDYTAAFRALAAAADAEREASPLTDEAFAPWLAQWRALAPAPSILSAANPVVIPRNHLVAAALAEAERGDAGEVAALLEAVTDPFSDDANRARFATPAPSGFTASFVTYCGT